jgi:hypothetical protein
MNLIEFGAACESRANQVEPSLFFELVEGASRSDSAHELYLIN